MMSLKNRKLRRDRKLRTSGDELHGCDRKHRKLMDVGQWEGFAAGFRLGSGLLWWEFTGVNDDKPGTIARMSIPLSSSFL